jgi:quinol monooxygenase YgiN
MKTYTPADLNDGFVVAITIEAKPGEEDRVADIFDVMVEPTMAEPATVRRPVRRCSSSTSST